MAKFHPVLAISGSQQYLRNRELQALIANHNDWKIEYVDGSNIGNLATALSPNSFFDDGSSILVIVNKPEKADLELLESHYKKGDESIVALLYYEGDPKGNTKFGKFLKTLGKSHVNHPNPKDWDKDAAAAQFCIDEAKIHGKTLRSDFAGALIVSLGADFGFLSFEILKMSILADVDGVSEISPAHIKGAMAPLAELAIVPVINAVALRNAKKLIKTMERLKSNSKYDPTMAVCSYLANSATRWLSVTDLQSKNIPLDDAAELLGLKPWYYKNKLFPQVANWNRSDVIRLINILADSKRSILSGQNNPWVILSSGLLELCR